MRMQKISVGVSCAVILCLLFDGCLVNPCDKEAKLLAHWEELVKKYEKAIDTPAGDEVYDKLQEVEETIAKTKSVKMVKAICFCLDSEEIPLKYPLRLLIKIPIIHSVQVTVRSSVINSFKKGPSFTHLSCLAHWDIRGVLRELHSALDSIPSTKLRDSRSYLLVDLAWRSKKNSDDFQYAIHLLEESTDERNKLFGLVIINSLNWANVKRIWTSECLRPKFVSKAEKITMATLSMEDSKQEASTSWRLALRGMSLVKFNQDEARNLLQKIVARATTERKLYSLFYRLRDRIYGGGRTNEYDFLSEQERAHLVKQIQEKRANLERESSSRKENSEQSDGK